MQTIPIDIISNSHTIPMTPEQIRVVEAVSPSVALKRVSEGLVVTVHDIHGEKSETVYDGIKGDPGVSPTISVTDITGGHRVIITDATGAHSFDVMDGDTGADGYSPAATVTQTATGATVTVTDKTGTTTAEISNGQDGAAGAPGPAGADGVSPSITVTDISGGHQVTVTDAEGSQSFDVMDGATGAKGDKGDKGDPGEVTQTEFDDLSGEVNDLSQAITDKADVIVNTASGSVASFSDGADDLPVQDLIVQIEPVQAGSGDPSPDNVRAITGWTGVNLTVSPTTDAGDGQTYSISFGSAGTIYGGSLDVTTGVLTVDRESMVFDGTQTVGLANWRPNETSVGWLYKSDVAPNAWNEHRLQSTELDYIKSDKLKTVVYAGSEGLYGIGTPVISIVSELWGIGMRVNDTSLTTAKAINAYLAQNPITVVYKLATPQTYQLTPTEIRTLLGENNIWADTGDVSVAYRADTKKYVDDAAPVQSVNGQTGAVVLDAQDVGAYSKPAGGIPASDLAEGVIPDVPVQDVQIDGTSIVMNGVAEIPYASYSNPGILKVGSDYGITPFGNTRASISKATDVQIRAGDQPYKPIVPNNQHTSTFYGLAKVAGSDEKNSTLPVGQYTESAKSAISEMLNGSVSVSGTAPTINAFPGIRYICGEVTTIDITTPASGIIDVVFTSGSTPAVLTVTPPSGMTMKWANGFDPDALEADTTYEINIADGCLGVCGTWS